MLKKKKIPAVFKEDLRKLLDSIHEVEHIDNCTRFCTFCSKVMTLDNIQILIPRGTDGLIDYICNDPICVENYNTNNSSL